MKPINTKPNIATGRQWFLDRIGQRVWTINTKGCICASCQKNSLFGCVIKSRDQVETLSALSDAGFVITDQPYSLN